MKLIKSKLDESTFNKTWDVVVMDFPAWGPTWNKVESMIQEAVWDGIEQVMERVYEEMDEYDYSQI